MGGTGDAGVPPTKKKGKRKARVGGAVGGTSGVQEPFEVDEDIVLTDADRRLEWRGDAVSLPPRTIEMGGTAEDGRPLDDGEIQSGVANGSVVMVVVTGPLPFVIVKVCADAPLVDIVTVAFPST